MTSTLTGSCLCGSVQYEVTGEAQRFYHCHCQRGRIPLVTTLTEAGTKEMKGVTVEFSPSSLHCYTVAKNTAIRGGRARERDMAKKALKKRLFSDDEPTSKRPVGDKDKLVIGGTLVVSRTALGKLAQRYQVRRLVLFGSAAREQLKPGSDIDLLVEFETGKAPSLGGMVKLKDELSALFGGRKVDVATPAILNNPYRQRAIEKDMEELYAARSTG